jgi:hypothetical protein
LAHCRTGLIDKSTHRCGDLSASFNPYFTSISKRSLQMIPLIGALAAPVLESVGGIASSALQKAAGGQSLPSPGGVVQNLASSALGVVSKGVGLLL